MYLTREEIFKQKGGTLVCDVECYPNYFLVCFKNVETGGKFYQEGSSLNKKQLKWVLNNYKIVTFNGINYDLPILLALLQNNYDEAKLHQATTDIIENNMWLQEFNREYNVSIFNSGYINHIDLKEVAFGQASLKLYAGRLGSPHMQELPYPPKSFLTDEQKIEVREYCFNDLENTQLLMEDLKKPLELRAKLSAEYNLELRSKSDAQIAESVIGNQIKWKTGNYPKKPKIDLDMTFKYDVPEWLTFRSKTMKGVIKKIEDTVFTLSEKGSPVLPKHITEKFTINESTYKMGIGGLHSSEDCVKHISDEEVTYYDRDVTSFYPFIILNSELYPEQLGKIFLDIFKDIVFRRIDAKFAGDKDTADSLKITINGAFGKLGSPHSILYSPKLLVQTTLTGQLSLLKLIEMLEIEGFRVVSANTDGVVTRVPNERYEEYDSICKEWESISNFSLEETEYKALYSSNVNNYIAHGSDDSIKTKGWFKKADISKNPAGYLVYEAVINKLIHGIDVEHTVRECDDILKFLFVRTVKGGALKDGEPIGKVVRWYQGKGEFGNMKYVTSGNKVPKTDGAVPLMTLDGFPDDLDYEYYIREAKSIIQNQFEKTEEQLLLI